MKFSEEQWVLAHGLLRTIKRLSGRRFTPCDVERIARGIARRTWRERELAAATIH